MFRHRSSTQNPTLTQDDHVVTPSDACTSQPASISLANWVKEKLTKAMKESLKQLSDTEPPPLKCTCGANAQTVHIEPIVIDGQRAAEKARQLPPRWKVELPVEFDQVLRRRINERASKYADDPNYLDINKPLACEIIQGGTHSTFFRNIDATAGDKCCDKFGTGTYYGFNVLHSLSMATVDEVLPGFIEGMGNRFWFAISACCAAGYVAELRRDLEETLSEKYCELTVLKPEDVDIFDRCVIRDTYEGSAK